MTTSRLSRLWGWPGPQLRGLWSSLTSERGIRILTIAVLIFGAALRLNRFLFNRSLFIDEAHVAANLVGRQLAEITQPLSDFQVAPVGWLLLVKLAISGFGNSEMALRLVPLLSGLASLVLVYPLSKRYLTPPGSLVCCLLLATTDPAIRWSVMAKPYSMDLLVAIIILLIAARTEWRGLSASSVGYWAALGSLAIWFSFPAAFVLAGVGLYALQSYFAPRGSKRLIPLVAVFSTWLLSFIVLYEVTLRGMLEVDYLYEFWSSSFASLPAANPQAIDAVLATMNDTFRDPVGVLVEGGGAALYLLGLVALSIRIPQAVVLLIGPILITYFVSAAGIYPFSDRLLLFSVPTFHLIIAAGVEQVSRGVARLGWVPLIALVCLLLYSPVRLGVSRGVHPRGYEEMRPVTEYVLNELRPEDGIYIYYGAAAPWRYYLERYGAADTQYDLGTMSRENPNVYREEISRYQGRERVWVVFSHVYRGAAGSEQTIILRELSCLGVEVQSFEAPDARAFLYDLSEPSGNCGIK